MKESKNLEFKRGLTDTFLKTVSAYANRGGGEVLFGVTDDGEALGVSDPDKFCLRVENKINDSISPRPDFSLSVNNRTKVVTLTVREGSGKPYLYQGRAYVRSGTSTAPADSFELKRLAIEGSGLTFDMLPCGRKELTFGALENKLVRKTGISKLTRDTLKTLNLYSDERGYNNAAAILADENDFPGIDVARFGDSTYEIRGRRRVEHVSALTQFDAAVEEFERNYRSEVVIGIERRYKFDVPEEAFREAVANALIHRTWDVYAAVNVAMFPDRIEVAASGGLPRDMTREKYFSGYASSLRNPVLANVFFRLSYVELFGTGVRRMIDSYAGTGTEPKFEITDDFVKVVLPVIGASPQLDSRESKVMETLAGYRIMSSEEIAEATGFSKSKTIRVLNSLTEKKAVKKEGVGRGTVYHR